MTFLQRKGYTVLEHKIKEIDIQTALVCMAITSDVLPNHTCTGSAVYVHEFSVGYSSQSLAIY